MPQWFEDESLWVDLNPFSFSEERLRAGEDEVAKVLALVGLTDSAGRAVLDLCCGPGRHAVPLAQRGMRVTGVDRTPFHLDRARERARLAGVDVEWVDADMRDFRRPTAYDLALSLFTSFGYFDSRDDDLRVLRNVRASLRSRGALVIDVMGKEWLARHFQPTRSRSLPDGTLLIDRSAVVDDWTRVENQGS
jgi:SAM-dependent methyltransferase